MEKRLAFHDTHPLVDLLVDGGLAVGAAGNFQPLDQRLDGQTLGAREASDTQPALRLTAVTRVRDHSPLMSSDKHRYKRVK